MLVFQNLEKNCEEKLHRWRGNSTIDINIDGEKIHIHKQSRPLYSLRLKTVENLQEPQTKNPKNKGLTT